LSFLLLFKFFPLFLFKTFSLCIYSHAAPKPVPFSSWLAFPFLLEPRPTHANPLCCSRSWRSLCKAHQGPAKGGNCLRNWLCLQIAPQTKVSSLEITLRCFVHWNYFPFMYSCFDRLCGLVVTIPGLITRCPGSIPGAIRFF
jgi:hypothetical protein